MKNKQVFSFKVVSFIVNLVFAPLIYRKVHKFRLVLPRFPEVLRKTIYHIRDKFYLLLKFRWNSLQGIYIW